MGYTTPGSATERQADYINDLLDQRDLLKSPRFFDAVNAMDEGEYAAFLDHIRADVRDRYSMEQASRLIDALKALPYKGPTSQRDSGTPREPLPDVPAGRYAVTGEDGTTDFYKVDRPSKGKWAGYTFVQLQLGPAFQRLDYSHSRTILQKIVDAGPREAAIRYGREIGACSVCGTDLTNKLSRELGIGPVCGGRYYADESEWARVKDEARQVIRGRGEDPADSIEVMA